MKKVKYTKKTASAVLSREESYDSNYGVIKKRPTSPYTLGLMHNDQLLLDVDAYEALLQPVWGNGVPFYELLPKLPTPIPAKICLNPKPWYSFDFDLQLWPKQDGLYETRIPMVDGGWKIIKFMTDQYTDFASWRNEGITQYRPYDPTPFIYVDNPDYPAYLALAMAIKQQYVTILKEYFVVTANYIFPGLPLDADKWWEDGIEIPISNSHPLAVATTRIGWKKLRKPMPPGSMPTMYHAIMDKSINISDDHAKIKSIVGLY